MRVPPVLLIAALLWGGPALAGEAAPPDDADEPEGSADPEAESHEGAGVASTDRQFTSDLDDAELERRWKEEPESLGSISIGFADAGRLVNAIQFPAGEHWTLADPPRAWATEEVVGYLKAAIEEVNAQLEGTPPLRVGHIGRKEGGWLRPHQSHQAGRDADICFYETEPDKTGDRFDRKRNWALVRALITQGDVQFILVDRRIQKKLYDEALELGEDKAWLDSLFKAGTDSLIFHARRHRDHFHVRYFSPRAQELGRRVQPLLSKGKPEYNVAVHRVKSGDTLGALARKYDTSVAAIRSANGISGNLIRAGVTLQIPLSTACTDCPLPPPAVVPPRRLPPTTPELFARSTPPVEPDAPATDKAEVQ